MKEFILLALKAKTSPDFSLSKLPDAGRMDLVCRVISNTLWISNDLRRDTIIRVALSGPNSPPKTISFDGKNLIGLEPDERTIAQQIKLALKTGMDLKLKEEKEVSPGLIVSKKSVETLIKETAKDKQLVYLHKDGEDVRDFDFKRDIAFVLGDYIGLPKKTEKLLLGLGAKKVKLGPKMIFASHCPIIVHNELDRRGL